MSDVIIDVDLEVIEEDDCPNEMFEPMRKRIDLQVGSYVICQDNTYRISQVLDFESVIGIDTNTGRSKALRVNELMPYVDNKSGVELPFIDITDVADADWKKAEERYAAIKPILDKLGYGRADVVQRAEETGVNPATLYRWIKRYNVHGSTLALVPKKRGWSPGKSRLSIMTDTIIDEVITNYYLTNQRSKPQRVVTEVQRLCQQRGVECPSANTIRFRITKISEKEKLRNRGQREKAKNKFMPTPGTFPNADYPLAVIQIDHTPADIILVDDVHRLPIGRPWITLAMDINTRMITGYYLSFDPPSETSVGMCVAQSVLPKDEWLLLHNVEAEWPVWGLPVLIYVDNGADFRSNNFQQSCLAYGINLEFRPPGRPNYGGHIERVLGTILNEIHDLPGTTFSNIKEREGYNSEKEASMTKTEFEEWLVTFICKVYNQRLHTGIGMTPLKKWEIGIFGNEEITGIGVPARPADRHTILLDFLPSFKRTVQKTGVKIDGLFYYAEALRPWINVEDPDLPGKKRKMVFRRDPRDISELWFFDPTLKQYYKIPFADQMLPAMSVWEYNLAKEKLKAQGIASVNEHQILNAITELRDKVDASKKKTKSARKQAQRRKEHEKKITPAKPLQNKIIIEPKNIKNPDLLDGEIEPYGDIS